MTDATPADSLSEAQAELVLRDAEEAELVFPAVDREIGWRLGVQLREAAVARRLPITIGITLGGQRLFHTALEGAAPDNDIWLERKTAAVLHYGRASYAIRAMFHAQGKTFEKDSRLDISRYAADGGVFPIRLAGVGVVGTVGISGLPQREDHEFVVEQLRGFLAGL